jgi:hypothetical protein
LTITFPRTDVMGFCGYSHEATPLRLLSRQELSFDGSGFSYGKDFGPGLWMGDFLTEPLSHARAAEFEAILASLDGVIGSFEACDLRKPYPAAYPDGGFTDSATLLDVSGATTINLGGLAEGFTLTRGDFLAFDYGDKRALHRALETVTANSGGSTAGFQVRPHIRPGYAEGVPVKLKNPMGVFRLVQDSVVPRMVNGALTQYAFKAVQDA